MLSPVMRTLKCPKLPPMCCKLPGPCCGLRRQAVEHFHGYESHRSWGVYCNSLQSHYLSMITDVFLLPGRHSEIAIITSKQLSPRRC